MTTETYKHALSEFCEFVGLTDAETLQASGRLDIDGFPVTLSLDTTSELIDISVDLGPVQAEREPQVYRLLLEMNAVTSRFRTGQVGIHGDSGHATFNAFMPLNAHTRGEDLARTLDHVINQADCVRGAITTA